MGDVTATDQSAQDISGRVEAALLGEDNKTELEENHDDVVATDDVSLPAADDTDSDDDDGSVDLEEIATEEEIGDDLSLAGYLGLDDDKIIVKDDGSVVFNAIIDGESKEVPLNELAKSYQLQGHVNNKSIALENERKEFETQQATIATELRSRLDNVTNMTKMVEEQLVGDFNKVNWDQLRVENPAEWTALRQEFADKAQQIQNVKTTASQELTKLNEEQSAQFQKDQQVYMKGQLDQMIVNNPAWADATVMKAETGKLKTFLGESYGFSDEDIKLVTDSRLIGLIQDAKAYRDGKKVVETKITKKVPKFQKPGAAKGNTKSLAKARSAKANKVALKKDGSIQNVANSILDRM